MLPVRFKLLASVCLLVQSKLLAGQSAPAPLHIFYFLASERSDHGARENAYTYCHKPVLQAKSAFTPLTCSGLEHVNIDK